MAGSQAPLYTCYAILCSVYYMILTQPLVRLTTVYYQSTVSMISFAQVQTVQWSNTIPCQNVRFTYGIHLTLFRFNNGNTGVWITGCAGMGTVFETLTCGYTITHTCGTTGMHGYNQIWQVHVHPDSLSALIHSHLTWRQKGKCSYIYN